MRSPTAERSINSASSYSIHGSAPRVGVISYEQIVVILREHGLNDLASDVERRIALAPSR